jgi:hypothetical protein
VSVHLSARLGAEGISCLLGVRGEQACTPQPTCHADRAFAVLGQVTPVAERSFRPWSEQPRELILLTMDDVGWTNPVQLSNLGQLSGGDWRGPRVDARSGRQTQGQLGRAVSPNAAAARGCMPARDVVPSHGDPFVGQRQIDVPAMPRATELGGPGAVGAAPREAIAAVEVAERRANRPVAWIEAFSPDALGGASEQGGLE